MRNKRFLKILFLIFLFSGCIREPGSGPYVYLAYSDKGLRIIDATDPDSPFQLGYYEEEENYWTYSVVVRNNYAYTMSGTGWQEFLQVFDISNPRSPKPVSKSSYKSQNHAERLFLSGDTAFTIIEGRIVIFDVSNPCSLRYVRDYFDTSGFNKDIFVSNNYAYIASWDYGLKILDITKIDSIKEIGHLDLDKFVTKVNVIDNYAYALDLEGLSIIDVSNPTSPVLLSYFPTPPGAFGFFIDEDVAYIAAGDSVYILNISNPSSPTKISCFVPEEGNQDPMDVFVLDNYAYVACANGGLIILDVSNLSSPREKGRWRLNSYNGSAVGIFVK